MTVARSYTTDQIKADDPLRLDVAAAFSYR